MHLVTKLHLEKQTSEQERRGNLYSLPTAKNSQTCLKWAIEHPPAMCVVKGWRGRKPYRGCDTIQRQLHMYVWHPRSVVWLGLAWHAYRVASLEYDSMTGKTIETRALPYPTKYTARSLDYDYPGSLFLKMYLKNICP